ncbi:4-oxalocrotonate tautomerase [Acidovorax sp. LjRoot129]|uniref:4-oxalocrotonate tautomerase n=1 Tax=Acidovorax sp. LjRoot129 TaxID=3342260 RepID=UPI003ECF9EF5
MPLTLTLTKGVLPEGQEKVAFSRLSDAMLKWHGMAGNEAMKRNIVGSIHLVPKEHTYSGSQEASVAFVEWKVPSFAFASREVQVGYIEEATGIIHELSGAQHPKERIWVNVVHAVDGAWGIAGMALTNAQLGAGAAAA